jgi:UDPglucose 6-dehydrogenase
VVEESQAITIANALSRAGARVVGYDPLAGETAAYEVFGKILITQSIQQCLSGTDVVLIASADPAFASLKENDFRQEGKTVVIFDCWRLLSEELKGKPGIDYIGLGQAPFETTGEEKLKELWAGVSKHE